VPDIFRLSTYSPRMPPNLNSIRHLSSTLAQRTNGVQTARLYPWASSYPAVSHLFAVFCHSAPSYPHCANVFFAWAGSHLGAFKSISEMRHLRRSTQYSFGNRRKPF
jgi:hypothetical protein